MKVFSVPSILCCALLLNALASTPRRPRPPDIFLITIDTLRADHVHCYGYDRVETPALDSLAKDGIRFAEAFTPSPITNSSHASILTGLLPGSHGVMDFGIPLSATHATMAELVKERGYHTAAFIGAVILDSNSLAPGFDHGFDFYDHFPDRPVTKSRWNRLERRGMDVARRAEAWLGANPAGPEFMWLHFYDPHDPYEPPMPYSQKYKEHLYDGEIAYADSALGNFIGYLKKTGRYRKSIIVVVGDHGEGLGEHHEETHGIFLYDSTTHVPLIVKLADNRNAGIVVAPQVRTVDILPTILDLADASKPEKVDGESLTPLFVGGEENERSAFGETDYALRFGWAPLRSVRSEGFKFIEAPRPEFYDLRADTAELKNKYEPWNERVQAARAKLANLRAREPRLASPAVSISPTKIEELRALGYLTANDAATTTTVPEPAMLPDPKDKIQEQNLLHQAMIATEDNRTADARMSLESVLVLDPQDPIASRQLGELELRAGEFDRAAIHFRAALEAAPEDANARLEEAEALTKLQDFPAARDALEAAVKLVPGQPSAHLSLGEVYLQLKNNDKAKDQFESTLLLEPDNIEAQLGMAKVEIAESNFANAENRLERISRMQPRNPAIFDMLAIAYAESGKSAQSRNAQWRAKLLRDTPSKIDAKR